MQMRFNLLLFLLAGSCSAAEDVVWDRHTIDNSSQGADGVRLGDIDGDGDLDIATPWEEGGVVRIALNPGPAGVKDPWPSVTIGKVASPEDAVMVDLDQDGFPDVVSATEGKTRTLFVHWNPADPDRILDPKAWITAPIPCTVDLQAWMWSAPVQIDGRRGIDLAAGGKGAGGAIGWLESPEDPRDLGAWTWHSVREAGWVMSIIPLIDQGGLATGLLCSDRKGPKRGVFLLEPVRDNGGVVAWHEVELLGPVAEFMFLDLIDINADDRPEIFAASKDQGLWLLEPMPNKAQRWRSKPLTFSDVLRIDGVSEPGSPKAVAVADLDADESPELVLTTEGARGKDGVVWLGADYSWTYWVVGPISGTLEGSKYDLAQLIDIDQDGDFDVLTCEERDGLGVIWYENRIKRRLKPGGRRIVPIRTDALGTPGAAENQP